MIYWQSDQFIVMMKQSNFCGVKGLTLVCKGVGQHVPDTDLDKTWKRNYALYRKYQGKM